MKVQTMPDGTEMVSYTTADRKLCPQCNTFAVVPLTPSQLAEQTDGTTHVCHPGMDGCNQRVWRGHVALCLLRALRAQGSDDAGYGPGRRSALLCEVRSVLR